MSFPNLSTTSQNTNEPKYSQENIANLDELPLGNMLECPVCNMISLTPVICKKCETVFCNECTNNWKKKTNECPMRCKPFDIIEYDKTVLKVQIESIKLKCPNEFLGCKEKISYRDMRKHESNCLYVFIKCDKCNEEVLSFEMINHLLDSCKKCIFQCTYCETNLSMKNYVPHLESCFRNLETKFCVYCFKMHKGNINQECKMKIALCEKCELPDLANDINLKKHICCLEKTFDKVNLALRKIHDKINLSISEFFKSNSLNMTSQINKFLEISKDINKKVNDRIEFLSKKKDDYIRELTNKNYQAKKDLKEKIIKTNKEIEEASNRIIGKKILLFFIYLNSN
jgi:hypothetical protein